MKANVGYEVLFYLGIATALSAQNVAMSTINNVSKLGKSFSLQHGLRLKT